MSTWEYTETEIWRHGINGVSLFHVFGLVARQNVVLVFAEARYGKAGDCDPHDIWLRRSSDGGRSFDYSVCLLSCYGKLCYVNPVPVWDDETGRVFLFFAENMQNAATKVYVMHSDDAGITWSEPQCINEILESLQNPPSFHLPGPGHGIQLTHGTYKGRLLVQFWHRHHDTNVPAEERGYCVSVLYSDDHGANWHQTQLLYNGPQLNECRLAQTANDVYLNVRTNSPIRVQSRSDDGGLNWSEFTPCSLPPAALCDAGCVSLSAQNGYQNTLLISHVSDEKKRQDIEICISTDGGQSFTDTFKLPVGDAMPGYSDLCLLDTECPTVGLVHCRNNHLLFSRISLQTLTGGKYENTTRTAWLW